MKLIRLLIYLIAIYLIFIYSFFNYYERFYSYVVLEDFSSYAYDLKICNISAYTPYCEGCSGITSFGYDVLNNAYYYDNYYGNIYILAGDEEIPFGSIIYFFDLDIYGIVLDRGSAIGYNKNIQFDLLVKDYNSAIDFGIKENIRYVIVRYGF